MSDSLVRVSRRVEWGARRPMSRVRKCAKHAQRCALPVDRRTISRRYASDRGASLAPIRFPPDNSKHSLTQFSKSFSSFPHGTCLLLVSHLYLALDGILPPDLGYIPKQPDSQTAPRGATGSGRNGALTLSSTPFQGTWARSADEDASPYYNMGAQGRLIFKLRSSRFARRY